MREDFDRLSPNGVMYLGKINILRLAVFCLFFSAMLLQTQSVQAQGYPAKPNRLVLPVAPGGDANGNIAHDLVAKAVADGYTPPWVNERISVRDSPAPGEPHALQPG